MNTFVISFDLHNSPQERYLDLQEAIKSYGDTWHDLRDFWVLNTNASGEDIIKKLSHYVSSDDKLIIIGADANNAHLTGRFRQDAVNWFL
jgi:hypothetical protein